MKAFEIIQGSKSEKQRRPRQAVPELFECPMCRHVDGVSWRCFAVAYLGIETEGARVDLRTGRRKELLLCTRCLQEGRPGIDGQAGAVARYVKGKGWLRLFAE